MDIGQKIRQIRLENNYSQVAFEKLLHTGKGSVVNYENNLTKPHYEFIQKLCNQFPEYALWLVTDNVDIKSVVSKELSSD